MSQRVFFCAAAAALSVVLSLTGCRGSGTPVADVSGTVTFEGNPVKEGRITFQSDAGTGDEALLDTAGHYTIKNLPVGEYKVTIMPLIVYQREDGKGAEVGVEKPAPDIPPKYRVIGSTDLKATVTEGKNEHSFNMKK